MRKVAPAVRLSSEAACLALSRCQLAEFVELDLQAVTQWTFEPQFIQQGVGF